MTGFLATYHACDHAKAGSILIRALEIDSAHFESFRGSIPTAQLALPKSSYIFQTALQPYLVWSVPDSQGRRSFVFINKKGKSICQNIPTCSSPECEHTKSLRNLALDDVSFPDSDESPVEDRPRPRWEFGDFRTTRDFLRWPDLLVNAKIYGKEFPSIIRRLAPFTSSDLAQ